MLVAQVEAHATQLLFELRRDLGVAEPDATDQLSEDWVSVGSVDVGPLRLVVVVPEGGHVLLFPSGVALHDVLVAQVEAHATQLLLELRRDLGVAGPDAVEQLSEDRVSLGSVDVGPLGLLVKVPEGGHVRCQETLVHHTCFGFAYRHQPPTPLSTLCAVEAVDEGVEFRDELGLPTVHPRSRRVQRVILEVLVLLRRSKAPFGEQHQDVLVLLRVLAVKNSVAQP